MVIVNPKIKDIVRRISKKTGLSEKELKAEKLRWPHFGVDVFANKIEVTKKAGNAREILAIGAEDEKYIIHYSNTGILLPVYQKIKLDMGEQFSSKFINSIIGGVQPGKGFDITKTVPEHIGQSELLKILSFYLKMHQEGELEIYMEEYPFMDLKPRIYINSDGYVQEKTRGKITLSHSLSDPFSNLEGRTEMLSINEASSDNLFVKLEDGKIFPHYTSFKIAKARDFCTDKKTPLKLREIIERALGSAVELQVHGGCSASGDPITKEKAFAMFNSFYNHFKQPSGSCYCCQQPNLQG